LLLFILVLKYQKVRTVLFQKVYHIITLLFIFIVVSLGYIGSKSIEAPYFSTGQKLTLGYFIVFLLYFFGDKIDSFFIKTALSTNVPRKNLVFGEAIKKFAEHKDSVAGFFVTSYQACKTTWNNFNKIDKTPPPVPPNNENENATTFDSNQISNENVPVKDFVKEHFKRQDMLNKLATDSEREKTILETARNMRLRADESFRKARELRQAANEAANNVVENQAANGNANNEINDQINNYEIFKEHLQNKVSMVTKHQPVGYKTIFYDPLDYVLYLFKTGLQNIFSISVIDLIKIFYMSLKSFLYQTFDIIIILFF
jgi:hypothetical protein